MVDGVEGRTMTTSSWLSKYMSLKTHNKAVLMLWFTRYADRVAVCIHTHFFLGKSVQAGKGAMRSTLCEAPTRETRPHHCTRNSVPYSLRQVRKFFNVPYWPYEDAGDEAYNLSSLSERTRTSNHLQMSFQRQHVLLSYFKTLSVGPVWGSNPTLPSRQSGALQLS